MGRTKVFVGNLSFKTREPGLAQHFETAGKVINAQIVTRGNGRSLGYGFVEFENEDAANKSIKDLNKSSLDEREINVELAKPRPEGAQQQEGGQQQQRRPFNNRGGGFRRGGRGNYQGGGGNYRGGGGNYQGGGGNYQGGGGYGRPYGGGRANYQQGGGNYQGGGGNYRGGGRRFQTRRPPKTPIEERNLQPSDTSLFVTNLPFKYTDEDFGKIFTEAGIKPKTAKVAVRFNGRSRGYGFVEFEKREDQQKALAAVDKKTVDGRELVVKVAMYDPNQKAQQQQGGQQGPATGGQPATQQPKPAQPATGAQPSAQPTQPKPAQPATGAQQPAPTTQQPAKPAQPATGAQQPAQPAQQPKQEAKPAQPTQPAAPQSPKTAQASQSPKEPAKPAQPAPAQKK